EEVELTPVSVGNPHAVIQRLPDRAELIRLGPLVEHHERFAERTNVQLVRVESAHDITVGVWERGAGETLSSGTSAVAASAAAVANGGCESAVTVHPAGGGGRKWGVRRPGQGARGGRRPPGRAARGRGAPDRAGRGDLYGRAG